MVVLTSLPPPTDGIRHQQPNTRADINGQDLGQGVLYIAESRLSWTEVGGKGFSLEYPAISLHAVSRDLSSYPHECLYVMVDYKLDDDTTAAKIGEGEAEDEDDDDDQAQITEIRFIPEDKLSLDNMFDAMAKCQALHPDEDDSQSEDDDEANYEDAVEGEGEGEGEGDGQWFTGPEGAEELTEEGQATLHRLENLLQMGQAGQTVPMETSEPVQATSASGTNGVEDAAMETNTGQFDDAEPDH